MKRSLKKSWKKTLKRSWKAFSASFQSFFEHLWSFRKKLSESWTRKIIKSFFSKLTKLFWTIEKFLWKAFGNLKTILWENHQEFFLENIQSSPEHSKCFYNSFHSDISMFLSDIFSNFILNHLETFPYFTSLLPTLLINHAPPKLKFQENSRSESTIQLIFPLCLFHKSIGKIKLRLQEPIETVFVVDKNMFSIVWAQWHRSKWVQAPRVCIVYFSSLKAELSSHAFRH